MSSLTKNEHEAVTHSEHVDSITAAHHDSAEVAPEAIGGTLEELPAGYYRSPNFIFTVIALCLGHICCFFGFVMPVNVLTIINEDLGPDQNYIWISIVYNLTQAAAFVLVGRLSDLLGRRWFFIIGNIIGLIGAIIASAANSVSTLIVGSALLGIAGAVQLSFSVVIAELIPNKWRGFGISTIFVAALPTAAFGPVIIRALVLHTKAGWKWSYYITVILTTIVIVLDYFFYYPPTFNMLHARSTKATPKWRMVDLLGVVLFTAGLVMLLMGISWGGGLYPWKSGQVIGTIVGGVAVLAIFVAWEIYGAGEYPLVPIKFFRNRGYMGVILTAAVGSMVYYSLLVLWPMQIGVLYETSVMAIGWKSCVIGSGAVVGQIICGVFVKALGHHKLQMVMGIVILTAFTGAMAATNPGTPGMAVAFIFIASISLGYVENVAATIGSFCLDDEDIGSALGLLGATRSTLASAAQAVFVAILTNKLVVNIPKYVVPAAIQAGLPESSTVALLTGLSTGNFSAVEGISPSIITAAVNGNKIAYSESFKMVYFAAIAFGGCGIIAALNAPNSSEKFNAAIPRKMHGRGLDGKPTVAEKEMVYESEKV